MSAFKQSMRKLGARAGLLAGTSAAVLAIAGIGAGSAVAAPSCPEGVNIKGMGSSLQKSAQEVWTGREVKSVTSPSEIPSPGTANALANSYRVKCAAKTTPPTVTYGSSGSGKALNAFGYNGGALNAELGFIGTDDGPTAAQVTKAQTASGTNAVILPVSQTAIAVMVHLPSGCTLPEGITWKDLNKVFGGNGITKWSQFEGAVGGAACEHEITRVVRLEGSGTTLQLKNYLQTLATTAGAAQLPCTTEGATTWAGLEEVGPTEEKPNVTWPKCAGSTPVVTAAGGGAVATKVEQTENTIGYAALPDAEAHLANGATLAKLQNGEVLGVKEFASPANTTSKTARCVEARYSVPTNARRGGTHTGLSVDWSTVFGAQPEIGGEEYPLCTLTYIAGWSEYSEAKYGANHTAIGNLVKDYVQNYIVPTGEGQSAIAGRWYSGMPAIGAVGSATNVQDSAEFIAEKLG